MGLAPKIPFVETISPFVENSFILPPIPLSLHQQSILHPLKNVIMQKQSLYLVLLFLGISLIGFSSCQEEEDNAPEPTPQEEGLTEEEAADLVETALTIESAGLTQEIADVAAMSESYEFPEEENEAFENTALCGVLFDTTIVRTVDNNFITAEYTTHTALTLICNQLNIPLELSFDRSMEGSYETNRWLSDDSAQGAWSLTNLLTGQNFLLNGNYVRAGYQKQKIKEKEFTSTITFDMSEIAISKTDYQIQSGLVDFVIEGETTSGQTFEITGQFVFEGNQTGTLTINGNSYPVEW